MIHLFNTRKNPLFYQINPKLKDCFTYRNKVATFYSSINYFILINDPKNKNLDRYWKLFDLLLKNTFSNGFIIHYRTGLLISTNAFREEFERVKKEFQEFFWSFKIECRIFENLNFIPFSFYYLPNSIYYSNETNQWNFPKFENKPVKEYFNHLAINYNQEIKNLQDVTFKNRDENALQLLSEEIKAIKNNQNSKIEFFSNPG